MLIVHARKVGRLERGAYARAQNTETYSSSSRHRRRRRRQLRERTCKCPILLLTAVRRIYSKECAFRVQKLHMPGRIMYANLFYVGYGVVYNTSISSAQHKL